MRKALRGMTFAVCFVLAGGIVLAQNYDGSDESVTQPSPSPEVTPTPIPSPSAETPVPDPQTVKPKKSTKPIKKMSGLMDVLAFAERKVFVGDEPVTITYFLLMKADVLCNLEGLSQVKMSPFTVLSVSVGSRVSLKQIKDVDLVKVVVTARLDQGGYGTYKISPFRLPYAYDEISNGSDGSVKKIHRQREVFSPALELEKVPLYVETDTLHEVSFIGQRNVQTVAIHADKNVEILNEHVPEKTQDGVTYLSMFVFPKPLILLDNLRQEVSSQQYRIVTYTYGFLVGDIRPVPFEVPFPGILWRLRGEVDVHTVAPAPAKITVQSILAKNTKLEPRKGEIANPAVEHLWLFTLPAMVASTLAAGIIIFGGYQFLVFLSSRKNRRTVKVVGQEEYVTRKPEYDTSWWARWKLERDLREAERNLHQAPDVHRYALLRSLLARKAVASLKGENRVDRVSVCAMTAQEIREKTGSKAAKISEQIEAIDNQLETANFEPLQE